MNRFKKIVLHIPHASDQLPKGCIWSGNIRKALNRWTDWHTDTLFSSSRNGVECFIYQWSRFYCDIERLINDPMEKIGQGIAYRTIDECSRNLSDLEIHEIYQSYDIAKQTFYDLTTETDCLIIDCHSFPSDIAPDIDICLGVNEDETKPSNEIIDLITKHFRTAGYTVAINTPYSNSICSSTATQKNPTKTIMIEVNKSVYLMPDGITPGENFDIINQHMDNLYSKLLQ